VEPRAASGPAAPNPKNHSGASKHAKAANPREKLIPESARLAER